MTKALLAVASFLVLCCGDTRITTTGPTAPASDDSPKAAPEMERLIKMWAGSWTTVEIFEPSDEMPKGKQDVGVETMRSGPGGLSLIGDYESHGVAFGHLVVTWIPQEKIYKNYWTDRTQPGVSISTGKWEDDKLVFTSIEESAGQKILSRDTYSDITATSFTDTLESGPIGGLMKKILTVKYTKQNSAALKKDPCDAAVTQLEMNQCSGQEYRKADTRLNVVYGKLMRSLGTETEKENLKITEKAWIQYRDLHCQAAQNQYEGGSMAPMVWADCMATVTTRRIKEIKDAYEIGDRKIE